MKSIAKSLLPIDIKLPESVIQENGTIFVHLNTPSELEVFWKNNSDTYNYAARGVDSGGENYYLEKSEWVFSLTKASLVKTVLRWEKIGLWCRFYEWSKEHPGEWSSFFTDRIRYRIQQISQDSWTTEDEAAYIADSLKRSPATYRGWWEIANTPTALSIDWFSPNNDFELIDPSLPINIVEATIQEAIFDDWKESDALDIEFLDRAGIEEHIEFLRRCEEDDGEPASTLTLEPTDSEKPASKEESSKDKKKKHDEEIKIEETMSRERQNAIAAANAAVMRSKALLEAQAEERVRGPRREKGLGM